MSPQIPSVPAVLVKNGCKSFTNETFVLNNFNMKVERGIIFGLLGGSGSGKTTLLSCLTGLKKLDSGDIFINGCRPGSKGSEIPGKAVGYMPQDVALYGMFKLKEIMYYFGIIYGMKLGDISERVKVLMDFLDLPKSSQLIKTMSGGEQRRVSLAAAMIHTPSLLILDEPTVGIDPVLRESIWKYLRELVSLHGISVVLTTHYIEEARFSDMVGFLRNGRLLMEKPPQQLLEEYGLLTLEEVVLVLCRNDSSQNLEIMENTTLANNNSNNEAFPECGATVKVSLQESAKSHARKILALVIRNFINFFRYPAFVFVILLIPTFEVTIFSAIIGQEPVNKDMGVINYEFESNDFPNHCENRNNSCLADGISCEYLQLFGNKINWESMETNEMALSLVTSGQSQGYLVIPANFTQHLTERLVFQKYAQSNSIDGSTITIKMDYSDQLMNWFLLKQLYSNYFKFLEGVLSACGIDPRIAQLPMKYNAIYGAVDTGALEFMQTPVLLLVMFLVPMSVAGVIIVERRNGTLDRTLIAGVDYVHVIISFIISQGIITLVQVAICLCIFVFLFNLQIQGSIFLCVLISCLSGICGLSCGLLFGTMVDYDVDALIWTLALYSNSLVVGGHLWPKEGNAMWVRFYAACFPLTLPSESIRSIANRGWDLTHQNVWPGFATLLVWIGFACVASCYVHKLKK